MRIKTIGRIILLYGSLLFLTGATKDYEHLAGLTKVKHQKGSYEIYVEKKEKTNEMQILAKVLSENTDLEVVAFAENKDKGGKPVLTLFLNLFYHCPGDKIELTQDNVSIYPSLVRELKKTEAPKIFQLKYYSIYGDKLVSLDPYLIHQVRIALKAGKVPKTDIYFEGMEDPPQKWKVPSDIRRGLESCEIAAKEMGCTYEYDKWQLGKITILNQRPDGIKIFLALIFFLDEKRQIQVRSEPVCMGNGAGPFPDVKYAKRFEKLFLKRSNSIARQKFKEEQKAGISKL